ncbi:hypothetical protein FQV39_26425 [Bosea sp. F3-2]|uniref:flagellar hook-length control protein FliK n=1 Tax=Bosea sp. F3-2 TaxID=2599640 RepID=UPI0011EE6075|nr:flagellar hook-length control protein FliK [Bosea sp. F3-2]QEL25739.1 hypothetical protein FQV39_26425 [Bosea sp. F3-2]
MSIQPVFTNQRASDAPASRRRAEGGEGEAFSLPGLQEESDAGAAKSTSTKATDKTGAVEEAVAAATGSQAEKISAAANGKGELVVKPGDVVAKPSKPQQTEAPAPASGIDFLIAMAAAQAEAAAVQSGEGKPKADGQAKSTEGEPKPTEAKTDDDATDAASQLSGADQVKAVAQPPHPVAMMAVPLSVPASAAGGDVSQSANASAIAVGDGAKPQAIPLPLPGFAKADASSAKATETVAAGDTAPVDGKTSLTAGHVAEIKGAEEKAVVGTATKVDGAPAAADPKLLDGLQQALGPLDLSTMLQQTSGTPAHDRLAQPFDPNLAANGAAPAQGQGVASGQQTPVHMVPIEIGLRAMSGSKQFDIRLDPDELGRVDVNLSISDKGEVSARLVVDRVETLHLLQRDARTLERAFEQAGLKPSDGGVDISLRDPSDQSAFRQNRQHDEAPQRPRVPQGAERADEAALSTDPAPQRRLVRLGGVDLSI